jgi:hypothetical protein
MTIRENCSAAKRDAQPEYTLREILLESRVEPGYLFKQQVV